MQLFFWKQNASYFSVKSVLGVRALEASYVRECLTGMALKVFVMSQIMPRKG